MQSVQQFIQKTSRFVQTDVWRIRPESLPPAKRFLVRHFRVLLNAIYGFREHQCPLRASAMTFYSILSIVPVVAMAFGVAKGFGFERMLERQLLENFPAQNEVVEQVITFAEKMLANTKGGLIAGIGVGVLFYTVIKVLGHIEASLNAIWRVENQRSIVRKITDYLSIMILGPVLVISSSSLMVFIRTQIITITERITLLGAVGPLIFFGLRLLPYFLIWLLFTLIYLLMPNTRVKPLSALAAGVVAGSIYQFAQWVYIGFQVGVSNFNAIYGSFAALPLFLIWLQLSWLIVMFGAVISASHQLTEENTFEPDCDDIQPARRRLLALWTAHQAIRSFYNGDPAPTAEEIARRGEIPEALIRELLNDLVETGVLARSRKEDEGDVRYLPGMDTSRITVKSVLDALDRRGCDPVPPDLFHGPGAKDLSDALTAFDRAAENSPANRLLRDMGESEEKETPPEPSENSEEADGENGAESTETGEPAQKPK
ncbi:MAG: YhjD/YihY/BrkB family envelope integrity protein [Desulfococcaceae bacterium]